MTQTNIRLFIITFLALCIFACNEKIDHQQTPETTQANTSLKQTYNNAFLIGAGLNTAQATQSNPKHTALIKAQFNTITAENMLKWERVHPEPDTYNFKPVDHFVSFGEKNSMTIIGHVLIWHQQTPAWVFQDNEETTITREALLNRMREHIHKIVGRYKGRIHGWDVVNEAVNDDGSLRQTPWLEIIGEDYISKAFEFAHEADPDAELYYNDYSVVNEPKRKGIIELVKNLKASGAPISGIGLQQHINMDWPTLEQLNITLNELSELGLNLMVTELDIDVLPQAWEHQGADISLSIELRDQLNPYTNGLPDNKQQALAERYAALFDVYYKHRDVISRVTFWNVTDAESWLNNWPVPGRTAYPLLFDRNAEPKPAYFSVLDIPKKH